MKESDWYPIVGKWIKKRFKCFATGIDKGTTLGRIDVFGLSDVGGNHSGEVEVISVEVKDGETSFLKAAGQSYSYSVYAERCYLADVRNSSEPFDKDEIEIASKLGIGLLALREKGESVREILSSPIHQPLESMRYELIEKISYSRCTICGCLFEAGEEKWGQNLKRGDRKRKGVIKAFEESKGFVYWIDAMNERQNTRKHRRYICPDCIWNLYRDVFKDLENKS